VARSRAFFGFSPATPEGAAIVASELLRFQEDAPGLDIDQEAGR
jgi:hypothetical protein